MPEAQKMRCVIAGGGPAGVMLGFLLARNGIDVTVLEKWPDFFRDFRGDTIHPSTMEVLDQLGLLEEFLKLPHSESPYLEGDIGDYKVIVADFSHLNVKCPFIAFIPQWDFLNFIVSKAKQYPGFHLMMETEATGLIEENGVVVGVHAKNPEGAFDIRAELVVGADGRHSLVRDASKLKLISNGVPMDVLWFRLSRKPSDPTFTLGRMDRGKLMVLIERNDYWQCGYMIGKGDLPAIKEKGLEPFRATINALLPWMADRTHEISDWNLVKLLTVTVDHVEQWYKPGLLLIGDAAHAMSPIGGVGINLAIQDAIAAANILTPAFKRGVPGIHDLQKVQKRREYPARMTQRMQVFIQDRVIKRVLGKDIHPSVLPWQLRLLQHFPVLRRIPAWIIGIGFRAERVEIAGRVIL